MSPKQIRVLLRRLELERLSAESAGPAAGRRPSRADLGAGVPDVRATLHAADLHELRRRAEGRGGRWG